MDIPLVPIVGGVAGGLLVQPDYDAGFIAGRALKANPVAHAETSQHGRTAGLADELQPLDNQAVKETEVFFVHSPGRL